VVDRLRQDYGARIELAWKAFELRPEPVPLPRADDPDRTRRWAASVLPMAAERGLIMKQPPIVTRTRLAFQAVEFARDRDRFDAMHRAIFEAFFRDGRDIGRIEVLADIAAAVDLPPDTLKTALDNGMHLARVIEQERQAADLGVTGVPAMFVGDDPGTAEPVIGAVPYDWIQAAVERALSGESLEWRKRALKSGIPLKQRGD
jgi:predicted DsbA family dithiol-disulfide isomerase